MGKILIVDDEKGIREIFSLLLEERGHTVREASSGEEALTIIPLFSPDLLLLDMNLPGISGIDLLERVKREFPKTSVIIMTAFGSIRSAVEATRLGAYDYLEKPVDNDELLLLIARALEVKELNRRVEELQERLTEPVSLKRIVGVGPKMQSIFQALEKVARVDGTVLITGESGTGKELVARAIHHSSLRREGPFVVVNCGAIPRELVESEFFGHTKGAFTDARNDKPGKFELAQGGTLFLDEVGDLASDAQVKLLRALGEREITRIGGTKTIPVDVRVIAATNKTLHNEVREGRFREDLYWRLAVLSLHLPPLRERPEEIAPLAQHFLEKYALPLGKRFRGISPRALDLLEGYRWPGNVRELESVIYEGMVFAEGDLLDGKDLPERLCATDSPSQEEILLRSPLEEAAWEAEASAIRNTLRATGGNRTKTAELLGISRKTLFNKMSRYDIKEGAEK